MFGFARKLWWDEEPVAAAVPREMRVYAIGDIHGRLDLLERLLDQVTRDAASARDLVKHLVFLGDYVDRGLRSRAVIDRLSAKPPPGFNALHLRGNHEAALLDFLDDPRVGARWIAFGGGATLSSYGIAPPPENAPLEQLAQTQRLFRAALPTRHLDFLRRLRTCVTVGDYHFVHAGVRPGVPLDQQRDSDRLWIREEFLHSCADHGKIVVHGHTITPQPEVRSNRIGIDTGAFATGRLTALVLEGTDRRFLCTA